MQPDLCGDSRCLFLSAQSTSTNKSRLRVLQAREQLLQDLFTEARSKVSGLSVDEGRYSQLLEGIIVEVRRIQKSDFALSHALTLVYGKVGSTTHTGARGYGLWEGEGCQNIAVCSTECCGPVQRNQWKGCGHFH